MATKVLIPSGVLGLGFDQLALDAGVARLPDIICIDGGSTDSGPFYLGDGSSKYSYDICKAEWRRLMQARATLGVPLVIGSCGTCGTDSTVDWMYRMTKELAQELKQNLKVARLYSQQSGDVIVSSLRAGQIKPLEPAPLIDEDSIALMSNIVALMGAEQIQAGLSTGADIILAGRTTDTASIAALPLMRGEHAGACWHGAKIGECGAFCSSNPASGVILLSFDKRGFTVEALADGATCTPASVSAHMLYENADPFILYEPGGYLDVTGASYTSLNEKSVRVEGSCWHKQGYSVKLESARLSGYQTTMLAIMRDKRYIDNIDQWVEKLRLVSIDKISSSMGLALDAFDLDVRLIGLDAALDPSFDASFAATGQEGKPLELGVLLIITASKQELATEISKLINPYLLHLPLSDDEDMPTFAFPYSPAHCERGALYEFGLNHLMLLDGSADGDYMSCFRLRVDEVSDG